MFARSCPSPFSQILRGGMTCVVLLTACTLALAQLSAGKVMSVAGSVKAIDPQGKERILEKGGEVRSGDKIVTADGALVQMRLNDGGYLSVRSGTEMVIDRFVYDEKDSGNSNFLVSLVRGGFRSITGLIGKTNPDAYQIRTSTATVGIRGTDHEPMVIPEGVPGMAALGAPGIYDKVNEGETFIRNKGGVLALKRGDVGFAPVIPERPPEILQKLPDFYKVDVKTDARDPKDGADNKNDANRKTLANPALLRPSLAARKDSAIKLDGTATDASLLKSGITPLSPSVTPVLTDKTLNNALIAPVTPTSDTSRLLAPTTTITDTSKLVVPTTTLIAPVAPLTPITTTIIAPVVAPVAPVTTVAPTTTLIIPKITNTLPLK
jgi:hypothetical protein